MIISLCEKKKTSVVNPDLLVSETKFLTISKNIQSSVSKAFETEYSDFLLRAVENLSTNVLWEVDLSTTPCLQLHSDQTWEQYQSFIVKHRFFPP